MKNAWIPIVFFFIASTALFSCSDESSSGTQNSADLLTEDTHQGFESIFDTSTSNDTQNYVACTEGDQICKDEVTVSLCRGGVYMDSPCENGQLCKDGSCLDPLCPEAGQAYACEDEHTQRICGADRLSFTTQACPSGQVCTQGGACETPQICQPGTFQCVSNRPQICSDDGLSWEDYGEPCAEKEVCEADHGTCESLCEANGKVTSFLGCEYYIVDMDNTDEGMIWSDCTTDSDCHDGDQCIYTCNDAVTACTDSSECPDVHETCNVFCAQSGDFCLSDSDCPTHPGVCQGKCTQLSHDDQPFGITISNPNITYTAEVKIWITGSSMPLQTVEVPPGSLETVILPSNLDVDEGGLFSGRTFFAESDVPITMHQFNPINGSGVFSNDASLLLPINSFGKKYIVLDYPVTFDFPGGEAYVDIIAAEDFTEVTITSPISISNAPPLGNLSAGVPKTTSLSKGDQIHLLSNPSIGSDLSGMVIESTKPIAVFSGVRCVQVPQGVPACDHIEQQLFPVESWGKVYYAAKSKPRGSEPDIWRIIASEDNTHVQLSGGYSEDFVIQEGEVKEIITAASFKVEADKPILVGEFLVSSNYTDDSGSASIPQTCYQPCRTDNDCLNGNTCNENGECLNPCDFDCSLYGGTCYNDYCAFDPTGDPAFTLAVPFRQYRQEYIVLTPPGYNENYLTIITPTGTRPAIDGTRVDTPELTAADMDIYYIPVSEGVHYLEGNSAFSVIAYGYDSYVSYAYPGGLNLMPHTEP